MPAHNFIDLTGHVFGRLTVVARAKNNMHRLATWVCECTCGNTVTVNGQMLRSGRTQSCGCLKRELSRKRLTVHGMTNTKEHRHWECMHQRCANKHNQTYGGRSVTVCVRWSGEHGFVHFLEDMGKCPGKGYSLDRIDNNKGYEPGNCRWATAVEQANNRRTSFLITFAGVTMSSTQWARRLGVKGQVIRDRLRAGHPPAVAFCPRPLKKLSVDELTGLTTADENELLTKYLEMRS